MTEPIHFEALLEHRAFIRGLARALLADAAAADDVAQDAFVRALENPPRHAQSLRSWLATIARRLALNARRADVRRTRREGAPPDPRPLPTPEALLEREEVRRSVVDAVLALEPALREAVIARHFEELSPAAAAHRLGIEAETLKGRLRRAHVRLRAQLDAEHGDRRWCAPLAAWAGGVTSVEVLVGAIAMKKLALCVVLIGAAVLAWRYRPADPAPSPPGLEATAPSPPAVPEVAITATPDRVEADTTPRASKPAETRDATDPSEYAALAIDVRSLDGAPIGIPLNVSVDIPEARSKNSASTNSLSSHFELGSLAPGRATVMVRANGGALELATRQVDLVAGETVRLEWPIDLSPCAGRLWICTAIRRRGQSLPLMVPQEHIGLVLADGRRLVPTREGSHASEDARWRFEGVPAEGGRLQIDDPRVEMVDRPIRPLCQLESIELTGNSALSVRVTDAATGLAIVDFAAWLWTQPYENGLAGYRDRTRALRDAASGQGGLSNMQRLDTPVDGTARTTIAGGPWVLRVLTPDGRSNAVTLSNFAPHETRDVVLTLAPNELTIAGTVTENGAPADGICVELYTPAEQDDGPQSKLVPGNVWSSERARLRFQVASTRTDATGGFRFERLSRGRFLVRAFRSPLAAKLGEPFELTQGVENLAIALPAAGRLRARWIGFDAERCAGCSLRVVRHGETPVRVAELQSQSEATAPFDATGSAEVDAIAPGDFDLYVEPKRTTISHSRVSSVRATPPLQFVTRVAVDASPVSEIAFEGRALVPAWLRCRVVCVGDRAASNELSVTLVDTDGRGARGKVADGFAQVGPLPPGRYAAWILDSIGSWSWRVPDDIVLSPGVDVDCAFEVPVRAGVVLVTKSAKPLREAGLSIGFTCGDVTSYATVATDADGRLALVLPPGRYVLTLGRSGDRPSELVWTQDGPAVREIDLGD